ncbi:MAG: glycine--tRNA ligase [Chloroflexi bacterium]|nr:glycine--tRNA ligase [Chloroflexota bacterium]MCI0774585.1 glycine--tRNA ligase [Chloroflexota bacterium]MCI0803885.1 glycine--tRNA ligase [Chloroflexota bacterium]MCI0808621.1 glycine--tRNA ligase [Chloroflexota bacterium]MCI0833766.1 glycine--tRNA ligase [Chloroflexota bacterium]
MVKRTLSGTSLETLVSLSKRRGFVFQSSEIYGGLSSVWDYGPVGVELKRNVKDAWWRSMVRERDDVVGMDASILMHPDVWVASGHLESFTDPLVECVECHRRYRADQLESDVCPNCGGAFGEPRQFNLMFKTFMGALEEAANTVYLRPETAQAMFVNFENVQTTSRKKIPFGIAQIGKSFRNEITPGNFFFRTREFEQMEMEYFCEPGTDDEWYDYWINFSMNWFKSHGIRSEKLTLRHHDPDELPHYSKASADIDYEFPWGWDELETISNRTDFDLKAHARKTGKDISYFDDQQKKRYVPFVVEPAMGADRSVLAFLADAYDEEGEGKQRRVVLRFHPDIAPFQIAVLPLSRNDRLVPTARRVYGVLRSHFNTQYDDSQSIGRRYRRQDEIGTPLCVTVDFETVDEDDAVTIRNRDTMEQVRVPIENLETAIRDQLDLMRADSQG